MARLRGHRPLNGEEPLYVRRAALTLHGRTFGSGDVLPWRELGINPKKLHQLWEGRRIGHEKPNEHGGAESQTKLVKPIIATPPAKQAPKHQARR